MIFTMIMELVLRDLTRSWVSRKLVWSLDEVTLSAICYADDVVPVNNGFRGYCKAERGGSVSWCTEDTLDESPKDAGQENCRRRN